MNNYNDHFQRGVFYVKKTFPTRLLAGRLFRSCSHTVRKEEPANAARPFLLVNFRLGFLLEDQNGCGKRGCSSCYLFAITPSETT